MLPYHPNYNRDYNHNSKYNGHGHYVAGNCSTISLNNGSSKQLKYCHLYRSGSGSGNQINEELCTDILLKTSIHNESDCEKIKRYRDSQIFRFYKHDDRANKKSHKKIYVKICRTRKDKFEHRKKCKKYKKHKKYKHFVLKQELNDCV